MPEKNIILKNNFGVIYCYYHFFFVLKINNSFSQLTAMKLYYQIVLGLFCPEPQA